MMSSDAVVEYDPHELLFRTPDGDFGDLYGVSLYPDGHEERTFLLRVGEGAEVDAEAAVIEGCQLYLDRSELDTEEFEFDYGVATAGETGIWVPSADGQLPVELENFEDVFSIGDPPLGATRGRPGDPADYRWLYVATRGSTRHHPLKRLTATANELGRVGSAARSWGRINYPLRDSAYFLRLTPATPRAAILAAASPQAKFPCHLRVDLNMLRAWLNQQTTKEHR